MTLIMNKMFTEIMDGTISNYLESIQDAFDKPSFNIFGFSVVKQNIERITMHLTDILEKIDESYVIDVTGNRGERFLKILEVLDKLQHVNDYLDAYLDTRDPEALILYKERFKEISKIFKQGFMKFAKEAV